MIRFQQNKLAKILLRTIGMCGELPYRNLALYPSERYAQKIVKEMVEMELLTTDGKGAMRTMRLTRKGYKTIDAPLQEIYDCVTNGQIFSADPKKKARRMRTAETMHMAISAGAKVTIDTNNLERNNEVPKIMPSIAYKKYVQTTDEYNGSFTRIHGLLLTNGGMYCVYNIQNGKIKLNLKGEQKTTVLAGGIGEQNHWKNTMGEPILRYGQTLDAISIARTPMAAKYVLAQNDKQSDAMVQYYKSNFLVTTDQTGIEMLRMMMRPNWRETILSRIFAEEDRLGSITERYAEVDADATEGTGPDQIFVLSHLDCDINRLIRFKTSIQIMNTPEEKCRVLCYDWQVPYVQEYLGKKVNIRYCESGMVLNMFE